MKDVLGFISDQRFHRTFTLPPNPDTGRDKPHRFSYADFGDPDSNAVVFFCGALMATRVCYSPLDQLAHACNVRIIHVDRPGNGGSDTVEAEKRIQTFLEMVPQLLEHLRIPYISLASHSGGDIYLLNIMLTYPYLLHPARPYVCFFAPWVHPTHSKITQMQATSMLPAPMIGQYASIARFVNANVIPLVGLSGSLIHGTMGSWRSAPGPISLTPTPTRSRAPSISSPSDYAGPNLDDPTVVEELRKFITKILFAESMDGISADAQLFMRKPRSIPWCSPSLHWSDINYAVPLLSKIIAEDVRLDGHNRTWVIETFHAESDNMVGNRGREWFDSCWIPGRVSTSSNNRCSDESRPSVSDPSYEYRSEIVKGTDHNFLLDPSFGASEVWLRRVRDAFPMPEEV
ncbi:hypothetical protein FB567DRAFT_523831 [Paraphoma chrysanthemicola]|uniref:AB hydrolase-1 domain-containing protein n=1 Tax=Paraphoma chrysanthemicola TaxID=798071 RepID=A0A8K0R727_9PLEO|nr:hypothetical protein FB567DRAFT_523831 [Paraphoma chrysanthemicola]